MDKDERLIRRIDNELDNMFIAIGKDDYRLHPSFVKNMRDVRNRLIAAFKEKRDETSATS